MDENQMNFILYSRFSYNSACLFRVTEKISRHRGKGVSYIQLNFITDILYSEHSIQPIRYNLNILNFQRKLNRFFKLIS